MILKQNEVISKLAAQGEQLQQLQQQQQQMNQQQEQEQQKQLQVLQQQLEKMHKQAPDEQQQQKLQRQQQQNPQQQRQPQKQQPQQQQLKQPQQQQQQQLKLQQQQPQQQQQKRQQPQQQQQTWSELVRRKKEPKDKKTPHPQPQAQIQPQRRPADNRLALLRRRAPKTAAVTIDRPVEGGSLAAVMKKVSTSVDLVALGVKVLPTKRTRAGGVLLEVEGHDQASLLATKLRNVVGKEARVRLPESLTPVLLLDVPEWAGTAEVLDGLQRAGADIGMDQVSSISVRKNVGGRGDCVARVNLPFSEAIKLAEIKTVTVGWTRCRVKPLEKKQPSCFRCQEKGHLAIECKNPAKPRRCFKCGAEDHLVQACLQPERMERGRQQKERPTEKPEGAEKKAEEEQPVVPDEERSAEQSASGVSPNRAP